MKKRLVKLILSCPLTHTDIVRKAMGDAGAGVLGNYSHCTFSYRGQGRFMPQQGANPAIGKVGEYEVVEEEHIETVLEREKVKAVLEAIKSVHPYEEIAYEIIPLLSIDEI